MVENPYFGFRKDQSRTFRLWERFNSGMVNREELDSPYERLLVADWERCVQLGIDATMADGVVLDDDDRRIRAEDGRHLLAKAEPIFSRVASCLFEVPGILILADARGVVLHIAGDGAVRRVAAERSGIVEQSCWLETMAGNNGIGSAIRKRAPVHVYSSEHYCEGWHHWTCAGAPIFGADGDDLMGVIDFTTIDKDYRDQALGLSYSLAKAIQAELSLDLQLERGLMIQRFGEYRQRFPSDSFVVVDRRGRPVRHTDTPAANAFVGRNPVVRPGEVASERVELTMPGSDRRIGTLFILDRPHVPASRPAAPAITRAGAFVTADAATAAILKLVERCAASDVNALVLGETGTGKELISRRIHDSSGRARGPYVAVNCGAISRELMGASFFGYVGGAFTGADPKGRKGFFEAADGGTLFLDEIGELPLEIQAALLRVLEDGTFQRVGSERVSTTNCRVIAATNRDLLAESAAGRFRSDLYYRLSVMKLTIPPLRSRPDDIRLLSRLFVEGFRDKHGRGALALTAEAEAALVRYPWPGNVRELRNVLHAAVICSDEAITADDLPPDISCHRGPPPPPGAAAPGIAAPEPPPSPAAEPPALDSLEAHERQIILAALDRYRKVSRVAKELGLSRSTLYRKFEALGIDQRKYL